MDSDAHCPHRVGLSGDDGPMPAEFFLDRPSPATGQVWHYQLPQRWAFDSMDEADLPRLQAIHGAADSAVFSTVFTTKIGKAHLQATSIQRCTNNVETGHNKKLLTHGLKNRMKRG